MLLGSDSSCETPCILVTGGAGYIGSNTIYEILSNCDYKPPTKDPRTHKKYWNIVVIDNFESNSPEALIDAEILSGVGILSVHNIDLRDVVALEKFFAIYSNIWAILHFAGGFVFISGLKSVSESVSNPELYYSANCNSAKNLLQCISIYLKSRRNSTLQYPNEILLIFASSACVYGSFLDEKRGPVSENCSTNPKSPYGESKEMIEKLIQEYTKIHDSFATGILKAVIMRYFNPGGNIMLILGAHSSGMLGENPKCSPSNLIPVLTRFAWKLKAGAGSGTFKIFGSDWPTLDHTPIRDYLHISDVARAHILAIDYMINLQTSEKANWNYSIFNIGSGVGISVLEIIKYLECISDIKIPVEYVERRRGDVGMAISNSTRASDILGWKASKSVVDILKDAWKYEQRKSKGGKIIAMNNQDRIKTFVPKQEFLPPSAELFK